MRYFPFFSDISSKTFLIIGGGPVALEKVNRLRRFTQDIIVIAPRTQIEGEPTQVPRKGAGKVQILCKEYSREDLALGDYVVAATGLQDVDRKIAADCRDLGIPVNVVDDREYCDFIFPSIVKRGSLTVAISTSGTSPAYARGTSPAYARQLREEIERILPQQIGSILERMGDLRADLSERIPDQKERAAAYRKILAALIESGNDLTDEAIERIIEES